MFYTSSLIYRWNKLFARQLCDCGLGFMSREKKGRFIMEKIVQTAGRAALSEFAPQFGTF